MLFKIAFRNILRNRRRSAMTLLAIAVGSLSIVLFGEFVAFVRAGLETNAVQKVGHLTVFRKGYFDYGAGNPTAFAIDDYEDVIRMIEEDPQLGPAVNVVTPTIALTGIAGNFDLDTSKTFLGAGYVPGDRDRMRRWDEHGVNRRRAREERSLVDDDESVGVVGVGLARVLGLCERLKIADCPPRPAPVTTTPPPPTADLPSLAPEDGAASPSTEPRIELLAATAGGAPNVMSLRVARAEAQGVRELDENAVVMHFGLAQKLLYGRGQRKADAVVVQLRRTEDMPWARARLATLFAAHHLDDRLEIRDFADREPFYGQAVGMFGAIFLFISFIMGVIVLFTVVNTMGMSVVERTSEIGTARAMGLQRAGVRRLFVVEGALLGAGGATIGVALAQLSAFVFNRSGATWTPPSAAAPVPLEVLASGHPGLLVGAWLLLAVVAALAAVVPANRAARLEVVDALRHV
ncbi:MAG TPA: FtsX-like permease family protein [Polyangia bacterium]|nr:FtsX-like permease family protein [Polyangia bacterium]